MTVVGDVAAAVVVGAASFASAVVASVTIRGKGSQSRRRVLELRWRRRRWPVLAVVVVGVCSR